MLKLERRERPVCKAAGFWSLDTQLLLKEGEASGRMFPLTKMVSQRWLCCAFWICRKMCTCQGSESFSSLGINYAVNDSQKQRSLMRWSGSLLPCLFGTVSIWPGFSFSLVQTKLSTETTCSLGRVLVPQDLTCQSTAWLG